MTLNLPILVRIILAGYLVTMLGLSPSPHIIRADLSEALWAQANNQPLPAAEYFQAVVEREPWRVELWLSVGRNAWDGGDAQGAIDALTQPALDGLLTANDRLILGDAYQALRDDIRAAQSWQQALQAGAAPGLVSQRMLDLHIAQEDYAAQVQDMRQMLAVDPVNSQLSLRLGQILSTIEPASALAYLSQAELLDSTLAEKARNLRDAIRTSQLASDPAFPFLQAGRVLAAQNEWILARRAFLRATETNPALAEAWAYLGEANYQTDPQDLSRARQALDEALRLDSQSLSANAFMALYWQRQGTIEQSLPYLQHAARLEPDNPLWLASLGQVAAVQGDLPLAQQYYEHAAALAPEKAEYYRLLAEFFIRYQIQIKEGALPAARKAVSLEPDDAPNLDVLGQALLLSGDREAALSYFQRAIEQAPEFAPALLHLGVVYLEQGINDLAYPLIEKARSINPGSPTSEQAQRLLDYFFP